MSEQDEIEKLLEERNSQYGNSYYATDRAISAMIEGDTSLLQAMSDAGVLGNWIIIMSKMNRAIFSPLKEDHWKDIAGYSNLNLKIIRGEEAREYKAKGVQLEPDDSSPISADETDNSSLFFPFPMLDSNVRREYKPNQKLQVFLPHPVSPALVGALKNLLRAFGFWLIGVDDDESEHESLYTFKFGGLPLSRNSGE